MDLINFLGISVALYVVLLIYILPRAKKQIVVDDDIKAASFKAANIKLLTMIKDLSGVASVTIVILVSLISTQTFLGNSEVVFSAQVLSLMAGFNGAVQGFYKEYSHMVFWLGLIGSIATLIYSYAHLRSRINHYWNTKCSEFSEKIRSGEVNFDDYRSDEKIGPNISAFEKLTISLRMAEVGHDKQDESSLVSQINAEIETIIELLAMQLVSKEFDLEEAVDSGNGDTHIKNREGSKGILWILTSNQFLKDISYAKRPLALLISSFWILSLIGWTSEPYANSTRLTINNLQINAVKSEVNRELELLLSSQASVDENNAEETNLGANTLEAEGIDDLSGADTTGSSPTDPEGPNTPSSGPLSPDFDSELDRLAQRLSVQSINSLANSSIIADEVSVAGNSGNSKEYVKAALTERTYDGDANGPRNNFRETVIERTAARKTDWSVSKGTVDTVTEQIKPTLRQWESGKPGILKKISDNLETRYSPRMNPVTAQAHLATEMISQALDPLPTHSNNELSRQGKKIAKSVVKKTIQTLVQAHFEATVSDAIRKTKSSDTSRERLMRKARISIDPHVSAEVRQLLMPTSEANWKDSLQENREARLQKVVKGKLRRISKSNEAKERISTNMKSYPQLYPRQSPKRSKNFIRAARGGFARGVIVGQPLPDKTTKFRNFDWTIDETGSDDSTKVELIVEIDDETFHLRKFDAAVVNQALRYAADERVVAVTMTGADGNLFGLQIQLHPVLLDTPLGCHFTAADQIIDGLNYSKAKINSDQINPITHHRLSISSMVSFMTQINGHHKGLRRACRNQSETRIFDSISEHLGSKHKYYVEQGSSPVWQSEMDKVFEDGGPVSLLENDSNYDLGRGDYRLMSKMAKCLKGDADSFPECFCKIADNSTWYDQWQIFDHTSQIRERPIGPNSSAWFSRSNNGADHLDFWLHTLFSRTDIDQKIIESAPNEHIAVLDFPQNQLSLLRDEVLSEGLNSNIDSLNVVESLDDLLRPIEDFVILQRLFRAILRDAHPDTFDFDKLLTLEENTRAFIPKLITKRWSLTNSPFTLSEKDRLSELIIASDELSQDQKNVYSSSLVESHLESSMSTDSNTQKYTCGRVSN